MSIWISTATQTDRFHTDPDCRKLNSAKRVQETTRDAVNPRATECSTCSGEFEPGSNSGTACCDECGRQLSVRLLEDGDCIGCRTDADDALGGGTA